MSGVGRKRKGRDPLGVFPKRPPPKWTEYEQATAGEREAESSVDPALASHHRHMTGGEEGGAEQYQAGEALSGTLGGGMGPRPMSIDQGIGNNVNHIITYSGTSYVHSATHKSTNVTDDPSFQTGDNCWTKIPWEFMQASLTRDEGVQMQNRFLKWKATKISVEVMNPTVIQEVGANIAQAGLNTNVNLYGYMDENLLLGWEDRPVTNKTLTPGTQQQAFTKLARSWKTNGIAEGSPLYMPEMDISAVRLWDATHPSVKQISCAQGDGMTFTHHIKSPYWRSTEEFTALRYVSVYAGDSGSDLPDPGNDVDRSTNNWIRWDECQGAIGEMTKPQYSVPNPDNTSKPGLDKTVCYEFDIRNLSRNLENGWARRGPYGLEQNLDPTDAAKPTVQTVGDGPPPFMLYIDSDPIPSIWLQLQPQANGANGTIASSCQIQFKISVHLVLSGCVPAVGKYYVDPANSEAAFTQIQNVYKEYGNSDRRALNRVPLYRPVATDFIRNADRQVTRKRMELVDKVEELEAKIREMEERNAVESIPRVNRDPDPERVAKMQAEINELIRQRSLKSK